MWRQTLARLQTQLNTLHNPPWRANKKQVDEKILVISIQTRLWSSKRHKMAVAAFRGERSSLYRSSTEVAWLPMSTFGFLHSNDSHGFTIYDFQRHLPRPSRINWFRSLSLIPILESVFCLTIEVEASHCRAGFHCGWEG